MAGTLSATFSLGFTTTATSPGASTNIASNSGGSTSFTIAGSSGLKIVQAIGFAAAEAVTVTDVGTLGWISIHNLDATNFVLVGTGSTLTSANTFAKLLAGEWLMVKANSAATYYAQADTASCNCEITVIPA